MLDSYIQGFEEARQFVRQRYDDIQISDKSGNPIRTYHTKGGYTDHQYKHGNRCPQGEYWVQPQGEKGFCRRTNGQKKKNGNRG